MPALFWSLIGAVVPRSNLPLYRVIAHNPDGLPVAGSYEVINTKGQSYWVETMPGWLTCSCKTSSEKYVNEEGDLRSRPARCPHKAAVGAFPMQEYQRSKEINSKGV